MVNRVPGSPDKRCLLFITANRFTELIFDYAKLARLLFLGIVMNTLYP